MRRNRLGINTFFGLSYFVFSFLGALIPDHPRNQEQFFDRSSANRVEVSLGANPIGQVNPTAANLSFAESSESGPGNVSFISTKPTKLPLQGTTLVPPTYPANGLSSVESSGMFINNAFCTKPVIQNHTIYVCSGVQWEYNVPDGGIHFVPVDTYYTWVLPFGGSNLVTGEKPQAANFQKSFIGTTPGDKLINLSNQQVAIIYDVTPRALGNNCNGDTFRLTVIVDPSPFVTTQPLPAVCSDTPLGVNFNSNSSVTNYKITEITLNGLTPAPTNAVKETILPVEGIKFDSYTNTTDASKQVIYKVVPISAA